MIDETDEVGFVVVNNFQPFCAKVKSIQCLKQLKKDTHDKKPEIKPSLNAKMIMHKV